MSHPLFLPLPPESYTFHPLKSQAFRSYF